MKLYPIRRHSSRLAINDWDSYNNVRSNHIDIEPGQEVTLKVEPVLHTTTDRFRALPIEERKCRYMHENPVRYEGTAKYRVVKQNGRYFATVIASSIS